MPEWSPQQDEALQAVSHWLKDKNGEQVFRLFGWAGTGKSITSIPTRVDVTLRKTVHTVLSRNSTDVIPRFLAKPRNGSKRLAKEPIPS